jgi:hypothetical protein
VNLDIRDLERHPETSVPRQSRSLCFNQETTTSILRQMVHKLFTKSSQTQPAQFYLPFRNVLANSQYLLKSGQHVRAADVLSYESGVHIPRPDCESVKTLLGQALEPLRPTT